jgi:hypothetical protein
LNDGLVEAGFFELFLTEQPLEETTVVGDGLALDQGESCQGRGNQLKPRRHKIQSTDYRDEKTENHPQITQGTQPKKYKEI